MLACYPTQTDTGAIARIRLAASYMRRKQFEARLIAVEVEKLFLTATAGRERVSEGEMIGIMGITPVLATYGETS